VLFISCALYLLFSYEMSITKIVGYQILKPLYYHKVIKHLHVRHLHIEQVCCWQVLPLFIGKKVKLRPLEPEDAEVLSNYINDWEVRQYLAMYLPISRETERDWVIRQSRSVSDKLIVLGIEPIDLKEATLIGTISLEIDWKNKNAELGIAIWNKKFWGKGYGTDAIRVLLRYAFYELGLHKIWLRVFEFNQRAIKCYENIGFKREGVLREMLFRDGHWHNVIIMGVMKDEFKVD